MPNWILNDDGFDCDLYSNTDTLQCDYLVIGAGTRGMAFTDGLLSLNKTCTVIVADKRGSPGGHWHDAPSFSKVAQTSYNYGVPSRRLESGRRRTPVPGATGDKHERASRAQVLSYYDTVMEGFVKTGRVRYFPFCSVNEDGTEMTSQLGGKWSVEVKEKVVDATFCEQPWPGNRESPFKVHPGVRVVPPNDLGAHRADSYVVIGAGRMGVDTLLYLMEQGVSPSRLQWVVPRDMWYLNREIFYPENFVDFQNMFGAELAQLECLKDGYLTFEKKGVVLRVNPNIFPTTIHGAWINPTEAVKLRKIDNAGNVIRLGHVLEISESHIILDDGVHPTSPGVLHIDCASNFHRWPKPTVPVWTDRRITVQQVHQVSCAHGEWNVPCSAATIGYAEATCKDAEENNKRCTPTNWPDTIDEWESIHSEFYKTVDYLFQDTKIHWRLLRNRPSVFADLPGDELARLQTGTTSTQRNMSNQQKYFQSLRLVDKYRSNPEVVPKAPTPKLTIGTQT